MNHYSGRKTKQLLLASTNYFVVDFSGITDLTKLPTALVKGGTVSFSVSGVKSLAGATLPYTTSAVTVKDATPAEIQSAFVQSVKTGTTVTGYKITLSFDEAISSSGLTLGDFNFGYGATPTAIGLTDTAGCATAASGLSTQDAHSVLIKANQSVSLQKFLN